MVYFRYVKRNGRQFGPYYYISMREDKKVKSIFLGKNFKEAKKTLLKIPFEVKQKSKTKKRQNAKQK